MVFIAIAVGFLKYTLFEAPTLKNIEVEKGFFYIHFMHILWKHFNELLYCAYCIP